MLSKSFYPLLSLIYELSTQEGVPVCDTIYEIPKNITSQEHAQDQHHEYPSAVSLTSAVWLVSDGSGLLHVLNSGSDNSESRIVASYYIPTEGGERSVPFKIHQARLHSSNSAVCILSSRHTVESAPIQNTSNHAVKFDLWTVSISADTASATPTPLHVLWHGIGEDVPMWASYDESRSSFFIVGRGLYRELGSAPPPAYEPKAGEIAPVPRADEALSNEPTKPPPYSWTQTTDSVTVAFPLPSNIPKSAIHVTLTAKTLSILIKHELPFSDPALELPRYSLKQWWDAINTSTSFWTWDREADKRFGLLTLHLDKSHEGTRWTHVFTSVGRKLESEVTDPTDSEVAETLDPSELYQIREALEKYTSALLTGEDASGLGLGSGMPSLAEGELDASLDSEVGRRFWLTWIGLDGTTPSWASEEGVSSYLLSTPLPGLSDNSLIVKSDIDGLLFELPPASNAASPSTWTHKATYSALAFVLASKRDTRFTHHVSSEAVIAFESGSSYGSGNAYVYRGAKKTEKTTKQAILKISGGQSGALLGVGVVSNMICCLCEQELVVVKSIL